MTRQSSVTPYRCHSFRRYERESKMTKCWICSTESDTSEHKIKRKDLIQMYGKGPYKGDHALVHFKSGRQSLIHGPNSKRIKFENNLCGECNSAFTQPFDLAYDKFIEWFENNKKFVFKKRVFDWKLVYGDDFLKLQTNLFKYFAKCLGCRIADHGS